MKVDFSPIDVAKVFDNFPFPYWIAGGWALDLFLEEQTREHEDVDVAILREDERDFRKHLFTWEIWPGLGNNKLEDLPIALDEELSLAREVLWCRPSPSGEWAFELLLNKTVDGNWVFKRDNSISLPIKEIGLVSDQGIPYLNPEIVLLFKAKENRSKDKRDFEVLLPELNIKARMWLKESLIKVHPGHEWLTKF